MRQNTYDKKYEQGKMLIEQVIEFELRGPGPLSRTCSKCGYFHAKTKICKANTRVIIYS